jgi:hypothetical protein
MRSMTRRTLPAKTRSPAERRACARLIEAAYRYRDADRPLNVVVLSDGMTEERERQAAAAAHRGSALAGVRVFCIGVGNDIHRPLLRQIAQDSGGLADVREPWRRLRAARSCVPAQADPAGDRRRAARVSTAGGSAKLEPQSLAEPVSRPAAAPVCALCQAWPVRGDGCAAP